MRLKNLLCLGFFALSVNVQAQDLKILVNNKGKVGYADQQGNEVIKCQYESGQPFKNGVAIVTKSGKNGIIDTKGNILLPLKYSQILKWNENLYLIKDGKTMGLADHYGKIILPVSYSHISKPNCYGKALIAQGGKATPNEKKTYMNNAKYGIIDNRGNILVTPKYKGLYEFSFDGTNKYPYYEGKRLQFSYHNTIDTLITDCSYLGFSNNGSNIYQAGIMDGTGKEVMKTGLYDFVMLPQSGMVRYYIVKKKQTLCGYHDIKNGTGFQAAVFDSHFDKINYWTHGDFIGDIAPVNGTSWSFIDKKGTKLRSGYTLLKHSQTTGLWAAKNSTGKWDVFNDSNNDMTSLSGYTDINFPANNGDKEIFSVMKDDKYGCISRTGDIIVPFDYEKVLGNSFDMVAVMKNGKWGILSPDNTKLIPTDYANILLPSERNAKHIWVMKSDSLYYHYNLVTKLLSSNGYKAASNFINGIAHVAPLEMKVSDTPLNRAQLFAPNTPKATIDAANLSKNIGAFGYLLNTDDVLLMDLPVSTIYKDIVINEIEKRNGRTLTKTEKKNILLEATKENRSYSLKATLSEDEWNY